MAFVDETMGALLIGVMISGIFWGVSCTQTYYYYSRYRKDTLALKILVGAVWISDTTHQALISHSIYRYLISEYGNPVAITLLNRSIIIEIPFNALTGLLVQSFFIFRIWRLGGKKWYIVAPVASLVAAEFGVSAAYTVKAFSLQYAEQLRELRGLSVCMNVFAAVSDVGIAVVLCIVLHVSRTQFPKSNHLISRLMVLAVNTGLLTSVCACTSLLTFFALPGGFIYISFYFLIGRLYCNSLLATLNARKSLKGSSTQDDESLSLQNIQVPPPSLLRASINHRTDGIAIRIDTTNEFRPEYEVDGDPFGRFEESGKCQAEAV